MRVVVSYSEPPIARSCSTRHASIFASVWCDYWCHGSCDCACGRRSPRGFLLDPQTMGPCWPRSDDADRRRSSPDLRRRNRSAARAAGRAVDCERSCGPPGRHTGGLERAEPSTWSGRGSPGGRPSGAGPASRRRSAPDGGHNGRRRPRAALEARRRSARRGQVYGGNDCPRSGRTGPACTARTQTAAIERRASISRPRPEPASIDSGSGTPA